MPDGGRPFPENERIDAVSGLSGCRAIAALETFLRISRFVCNIFQKKILCDYRSVNLDRCSEKMRLPTSLLQQGFTGKNLKIVHFRILRLRLTGICLGSVTPQPNLLAEIR